MGIMRSNKRRASFANVNAIGTIMCVFFNDVGTLGMQEIKNIKDIYAV